MKVETSESLRERAIERARIRVQQYGVDTLKLSDVARDLSVSHAALYKYFVNKQDLIDAINIAWMEDTTHKLLAICDQGEPPCSRIKQWFVALYRIRREKALRDNSEFDSYVKADELKRPCIKKDDQERRLQLAEVVDEAMQAGHLRRENSEKIVSILFHAADYFIHPSSIASHAQDDKSGELEQMMDVLLKGLRP